MVRAYPLPPITYGYSMATALFYPPNTHHGMAGINFFDIHYQRINSLGIIVPFFNYENQGKQLTKGPYDVYCLSWTKPVPPITYYSMAKALFHPPNTHHGMAGINSQCHPLLTTVWLRHYFIHPIPITVWLG